MIFLNPFEEIMSKELSCWVRNGKLDGSVINILYYKWQCTKADALKVWHTY